MVGSAVRHFSRSEKYAIIFYAAIREKSYFLLRDITRKVFIFSRSELLTLFASYMKKQEVLSKLTESEKLHGYNYSEIHTIDAIGKLEEPNVTAISEPTLTQ